MLNATRAIELSPYIVGVGETCSVEKRKQDTREFVENCFKDRETLETIRELLHEDVKVFAEDLILGKDEFMEMVKLAYDPNVTLQILEVTEGDKENTTVAKVVTLELSTPESAASPYETVNIFTWKGDKIIQIENA
jgi:hypothetical protein